MSDDKRKYWFAAKRYGWGWGRPLTWQGWVVAAAFLLLVACNGLFVLPRWGPAVFFPVLAVLVAMLFAVCRATGEPPHWRWGK